MNFKTANELLKEALKEKEPFKRELKFYKAINSLFRAGMFDKSLYYLKNISRPDLYIEFVTNEFVISKIFEMGRKDDLVKLLNNCEVKLNEFNSESELTNYILKIADSWLKIGSINKTTRLLKIADEKIQKMDNNSEIDELRLKMAEILSKMGSFKEARKVVENISDNRKKSLGLLYIVKAYTYRNKLDDAILIANEIPNTIQKSNAFTYIAVGYLNNNNRQGALKILELIKVEPWARKIESWIKRFYRKKLN
ncbi:MAG: hypothetical protein ACTSVV_00280 [Promethearchaeota archaeon]